MNESIAKYKEILQKRTFVFIEFITRHRAIVVFMIASAAVIAAVVQASTSLNPPRDETKFQEEVLLIDYSNIDQEIVEKLQQTQDSVGVDIDTDFDPTRNNPFAE